ncbi:MAG TPA: hypothetical protein VHW46_05990 [Terracidiphilus sp.]|jgi:hypothetical protein|nr:hypothetical protein [Terracidiphilus sp.]
MELIERYLQAVKKYLPWKRQDDILAELRANMESQLEDKEATLGRVLTQGELEDWLRALGSPMMVASRYQPQRSLIGPALFPVYLYVLRIAVLWAIVIYTVVNAVVILFATTGAPSVIDAVLRLPGVLITVAAWVTLTFAAFEFVRERFPEKCPPIDGISGRPWSPSSLPPLEKNEDGFGKPRRYAYAVAEVVFGFIFLVWLLLIPRHPFLLFGPGMVYMTSGPFELSPIWWTFFWWCVAVNVVQLAWRSINLLRGNWQVRSRVEHLVTKACGLIPLGVVLLARDSAYILLRNPAVEGARYGATLDTINKSVHWGLMATCVLVVAQLVWDLGLMLTQTYRKRAAASH